MIVDASASWQLTIWGYAVTADDHRALLDHDARLAEDGHTIWDQTQRWLDTHVLIIDTIPQPVPTWWALPHLPIDWRQAAALWEAA